MSAVEQPTPNYAQAPEQLDYLLRRAEQESIAAIRTIDPRAAEPHARMACAFTERALTLLDGQIGSN